MGRHTFDIVGMLRGRSSQGPALHLSFSNDAIRLMRWLQVGLAAVSLANLAVAYWWWQGSVADHIAAEQVEAVTARLTQANQQFRAAMNKDGLTLTPSQLAETKAHVAFANDLTARRGFSWARLLSDLEEATPDHIAFSSVQVNLKDKTVSLQGAARSLKDLNALVSTLNAHPAFSKATLASHVLEGSAEGKPQFEHHDAEGGSIVIPGVKQVVFTMTVEYAQPV
jgi:Tfp pilus assembly protein PilN